MPLIKLFTIYDHFYVDHDNVGHLGDGVSDWEEVSDEDLAFIRANRYTLEGNGRQLAIVEKIDNSYETIRGIRATIERKRAKEDAVRAAEKAKRAEAAARRKQKKKDKEKADLLKLLADYPELAKELKEKL